MNDPVIDLTPTPASTALPPVPAAPSITAEPAEDAAARSAAFSGAHFWNDRKLHGFSVSRFCIFQAHRTSVGAPFIHLALRDGAAFFPDALRILWICSVGSDMLELFSRDPAAMEREIHRWAETECPLHRIDEAVSTAITIYDGAQINQHQDRHDAIERKGSDSGN